MGLLVGLVKYRSWHVVAQSSIYPLDRAMRVNNVRDSRLAPPFCVVRVLVCGQEWGARSNSSAQDLVAQEQEPCPRMSAKKFALHLE